LVHPIAVHKGVRLFDEGETPIPLTLISSGIRDGCAEPRLRAPAESTGDATYEDAKAQLPQPEQ
jgi:hypothetical protein